MKRYLLLVLCLVCFSKPATSQEWLTSWEAAKRIALVQDKMLLVIWENAAEIPYPIEVYSDRGTLMIFNNLFGEEKVDQLIWKYFVPVKVSESLYSELNGRFKKTRDKIYLQQLENDNLKIVDVNFNIINHSYPTDAYFNLSDFIKTYALNTSFLKSELENYMNHKDFGTAYRLASKYMDYALLVQNDVRQDIVKVALNYLDEAEWHLESNTNIDKVNYTQKIELLQLIPYLINHRPGKVLRILKRMDQTQLDESNKQLQAFIYYTAYKLKNDKENILKWQEDLSLIYIKKANLILNLQH